jgi:hypothetical protein
VSGEAELAAANDLRSRCADRLGGGHARLVFQAADHAGVVVGERRDRVTRLIGDVRE